MNIALIGLDTSHAGHFAAIFNDSQHPMHLPGFRVVAAFPGGSERVPHSFAQIPAFTAKVRDEYGVEIVDSIAALCGKVDAYFITSVDAAQHPGQFAEVVAEGKPVFVDKPFAFSLAEARAMFDMARSHRTPLFTSSALRFDARFIETMERARATGPILGCDLFGPMVMPEGGKGYFWYGIHSGEMLLRAMGDRYEGVALQTSPEGDLLTVRFTGGRLASLRGTRVPHFLFGGTFHTAKGPFAFAIPEGTAFYGELAKAVAQFLTTGVSPVPEEETLGLISLLEEAEALRCCAAS